MRLDCRAANAAVSANHIPVEYEERLRCTCAQTRLSFLRCALRGFALCRRSGRSVYYMYPSIAALILGTLILSQDVAPSCVYQRKLIVCI